MYVTNLTVNAFMKGMLGEKEDFEGLVGLVKGSGELTTLSMHTVFLFLLFKVATTDCSESTETAIESRVIAVSKLCGSIPR
jgi:hypothetical protein